MMADGSVKTIKKIKDSQGRPIFIPGYDPANNGKLDTLLGYPIKINQSVAVMAANAKSIAFGDMSKYVIRDVMDIILQRYTDSAYAKKGQVGFLAWLRSGGNLMDVGGAVKLYQNRSEEHTSELQSLMRISYAVFCLKKKKNIIKKSNNQKYTTDVN